MWQENFKCEPNNLDCFVRVISISLQNIHFTSVYKGFKRNTIFSFACLYNNKKNELCLSHDVYQLACVHTGGPLSLRVYRPISVSDKKSRESKAFAALVEYFSCIRNWSCASPCRTETSAAEKKAKVER